MTPRVSVMMPCYNAARTLPEALASLVLQSYENWECLVVDDGSTDETREVVSRLADPRVRLFGWRDNRGRAVARQEALARARGDLACVLDADDWYYPHKLAVQVELMDGTPDLAAASSTVAVVGEGERLLGVRPRGCIAPVEGRLTVPGPPPLPHGPVVLRASLAREVGFDPRFRRSQDMDFLLRCLIGRRWLVGGDVTYAYREPPARVRGKLLRSTLYTSRALAKHLRRFPVATTRAIGLTLTRGLASWTLCSMGGAERIARARNRPARPEEQRAYHDARAHVAGAARELFSTGWVEAERVAR